MVYSIYNSSTIEGASYKMEFVKDKKWLVEHLNDETIRVIDCRYDLSDPDAGRNLYQESHILGASYFDLKEDLSSPVKEHGGRHPLPDLEVFKKQLEESGIDRSKTVIAYDDGGSMYAARVWWLLNYIGHEKVYLLEEGFTGWEEKDYPVSNERPDFETANGSIIYGVDESF